MNNLRMTLLCIGHSHRVGVHDTKEQLSISFHIVPVITDAKAQVHSEWLWAYPTESRAHDAFDALEPSENLWTNNYDAMHYAAM